jgi:hypothetical protein
LGIVTVKGEAAIAALLTLENEVIDRPPLKLDNEYVVGELVEVYDKLNVVLVEQALAVVGVIVGAAVMVRATVPLGELLVQLASETDEIV